LRFGFLYLEWISGFRQYRTKGECILFRMDEGRKRVIGIMAAILASLHMQTADDLFGGPQGSPRTDKLIAASVQLAQEIMKKVDSVCGRGTNGNCLYWHRSRVAWRENENDLSVYTADTPAHTVLQGALPPAPMPET
jgi:hypothetical protein